MTPQIIEKLLWIAASSLGTLAVSYFVMGMKVSNELAHVKGQLQTLMAFFATVQKAKETIALVDKEVTKAKYDLNNLWDRVKKLEESRANGSGHG